MLSPCLPVTLSLYSGDPHNARLARFALTDDLALHEVANDGNVRRQVRRDFGNGEFRRTIRQGERKNDLIGTMRIDGGGGRIDVAQNLIDGFIGNAFGRLAARSEAEE